MNANGSYLSAGVQTLAPASLELASSQKISLKEVKASCGCQGFGKEFSRASAEGFLSESETTADVFLSESETTADVFLSESETTANQSRIRTRVSRGVIDCIK